MSAAVECMKCHTPLPDNSRFCFACGADQTGGGTATVTSGEVEGLQGRLQKVVTGKYELKRMVGKGGMGAVFLAQDLTLDREVAIKVLPPDISQDPQVVKRFQQEARTAAKLDHTNIIPIYRVESEGGLNYFVMKFIAGTSLEDVLEHQKEPLSPDYIQRVLWEAARALGHAHQRGIVHRDVKPANIMFDHDGKVMLTDFGISKALQAASGFTGTGMIIGTPHYMAPEQAKGQPVDGRADQYSLGVVGYRMVTGQLPFSGDSVHTILYKHIFEEPPQVKSIRVDVPDFLSQAIARSMAKEPAQRYATMEEMATALWPEQPVTPRSIRTPSMQRPRPPVTAESPTEAFASAAGAATTPLPSAAHGARPAPRPAHVATPAKKKSSAGLVIGLLVVVAAGVGGYLALRPQAAPPAAVNPPPAPAPSAPARPLVRDVRLQPPTAMLRPGGTVAFTATLVDSTGAAVAGERVEWTSSDPRIARVDAAGRVTAVAAGLAMIFAKAGDVRGEAAVQVQAPQTAAAPPRPPAQTPPPAPAVEEGYLSIDAVPYGTVFVDGVEIGPTPIARHPVKPGAHTIRIENPGFRTHTERVTVDAGNTVRKRIPLVPEGSH
jgi:serine/threonine-protein kinase